MIEERPKRDFHRYFAEMVLLTNAAKSSKLQSRWKNGPQRVFRPKLLELSRVKWYTNTDGLGRREDFGSIACCRLRMH